MKNLSKKNLYIIPALLLLILGGCAKYKTQPLAQLLTYKEEKSVSFAYKVFSPEDCKKYLDRKIIANGYQPVQITITNNSNDWLYFSQDNINLSIVNSEKVAKKVHTSTVKRAGGYGIGSLFVPVLLVPAIVDGVKSSGANSKLDIDFINKELKNQEIAPYSTVNGLIFVENALFKSNFDISLINLKNKQKINLSTSKQSIKLG